jgi:signal transduction histidine kinase/CheY-like chemotaxis protein
VSKIGLWLEKNKDRVIETWEDRVKEALPPSRPLGEPELDNSIPDLYDQMIQTLTAPEPKAYLHKVEKALGKSHGEQRSRFRGYSLNHVIEEYQLLRQVIFDVARECEEVDAKETDIILETITIGIRNAAAAFTKIRTAQLLQSKTDAESANVAKPNFLANMSHEIRTPLGVILGFSAMLKESGIGQAERDQYVDTILRNGNALTKIIDDILDLAKVEAGQVDIEHIPFSFYDFMIEATDIFKDKAKLKGIFLLLEIGKDVPTRICSDPTRIRQILINLIGNAIKFTSEGGVRVTVGSTLNSEGILRVNIDVKDSGIGLSEEQRAKLFQPFAQADNTTTRKFGGTGLGLALSRKLSHALGGSVEISECGVGQGCTFRVVFLATIPKAKQKITELRQETVKNSRLALQDLRILVADDSADNLFLVTRMLIRNGATVDTAANGEFAVKMALAGTYDAVLMDIQMPVLDGYGATAALLEKGYKAPIIALTAHAMAEDRIKTEFAGFAAHLTKPLDPKELVANIKNLLANQH